MTDKRFYSEDNCVGYYTEIIDKEKKINLTLDNPQQNLTIEEVVDLLNKLHEEKELWKRECKRLKGLYYLENENVRLEDIIGLVRTDEPTDSVELKKELYK